MDMIRAIVLAIEEEKPLGDIFVYIDRDVSAHHLKLVEESGLIFPETRMLTMAGHNFAALARDPNVWAKTDAFIRRLPGGTASFKTWVETLESLQILE